MTDLDVWNIPTPEIDDDQAQHMRLVVAGHTQDVDDTRQILQALGLIPDPLCDRWEITSSRKHRLRSV